MCTLDALCLWVCVRAYGVEVPFALVLAAYGAANLLGLLPLTPGGACALWLGLDVRR